MYAITEKLIEFRKAKHLTQNQIAELLHIEQTTYSKIELAKSYLRYETALKLSQILEHEISEFTTMAQISNNITDATLTNSSVNVNGDVTYNNCGNTSEKLILLAEQMLSLLKNHFKKD